MRIDITREPPADLFRYRSTYIRIAVVLLSLVVFGLLLMAFAILAAVPSSKTLETVALALVVGPGLVFVYFAEKLKTWKRLGPDQRKELAGLAGQHPEIAAYCAKVAQAGREPVLAEYEAAKEWIEESGR